MARSKHGKSCAYRVSRQLSGDFTHNRHGFYGYYAFNCKVSLIRDTQEVRGLPEKSKSVSKRYTLT